MDKVKKKKIVQETKKNIFSAGFITTSAKQTQKMGELLARELKSGAIICLSGDLGSGKTTFTQGLLKGLKVAGPYTSPTFLIMKQYKKEIPNPKSQKPNKLQKTKYKIQNIYHIDAYRIKDKDVLNLGWEEIVAEKNNVIIVEWADRIRKIIPKKCLRIKFEWIGPPRVDKRHSRVEAGENKRKIIFN
jgi:tRNA threonylcarbamoyladenosine biosynthesis protein TsaE